MKKIGRLMIVSGVILVLLMIFLETVSFRNLRDYSKAIGILLVLSSIVFSAIGITFIYFNATEKKRNRAIIIICTLCSLIFAMAIYSKRNYYAGASAEFVLSILIFSFAALPLISKMRYEKRKQLFTQKQILLSFLDLFSIILIVLSVLFKLMHWPGANYMLIFGVIGFLVSTYYWNRYFKKEVSLRYEAESKLKHAFGELEEKNKEIIDSINYAQRIQHALLASDSMLKKNLPDHFVLFKPKDVVSGDFYWATNAHNKFYFIIADSTGHGVPGAFMSLLNISFLNEAINEKGIEKPNDVLNYVRQKLISALAIEGSDEGGNDGMDCSLMVFDSSSKKMEVCCANNPIIIIRNNEIIEIAADKIPVGKSVKNNQSFTLQTIELQKDDMLFAFTDGFADQFGGPKGKKLKYKQLCENIIKNKNLSLKTQQEELFKLFSDWKGELEQIDDVLIAGIKI